MIGSLSNTVPRWRVLAGVRRRRQQAALLAQRQQQQQQQEQQNPAYFEDSLFTPPSTPNSQDRFKPTLSAQNVLSLLRQNPSLPIAHALSEASFSPSPENFASLLDHLQEYPILALQTLIWALRLPGFDALSPLLAPRIGPLLPLPKPPSVDRFLADTHAFFMHPDLPIPLPIIDSLVSLFCFAAATVDDILEVFDAITRKGGNLGPHHFNQVLQAAVSKQHNNAEKAQWIFKHMLKYGPPPNATSYNILIYGLSEAGNTSEAQRLFDEMMANNLSVTQATYSSLVSGIVKTGELDRALFLMQEMKYNGLRPSPETYFLVLKGLCGKGIHQTASSLLDEMGKEGIGLDDNTYQTLVSSLCNALGVQKAEAHQMLYAGNQQARGLFG